MRPAKPMMRAFAAVLLCCTSMVMPAFAQVPPAGQQQQLEPNILVILADNVGYGDLGLTSSQIRARSATSEHSTSGC
jgi:hypothetical protein